MDSINIYDIAKESWYTQRASGQIPRDRYAFCTSVAVASDNSSYNVVIHGGMSMNDIEAFSDTYMLSIPSFEFFEVDKGVDTAHRCDHTCHLRKNKLFVIGGRGADQEIPSWGGWLPGACDHNGLINILDINTLEWDSTYNPEDGEDFLVPKNIYKIIGGK